MSDIRSRLSTAKEAAQSANLKSILKPERNAGYDVIQIRFKGGIKSVIEKRARQENLKTATYIQKLVLDDLINAGGNICAEAEVLLYGGENDK